MTVDNEEEFLRRWSARGFDRVQLASIAALHEHMLDYASNAWRPMRFLPLPNTLVIGAVEVGIALLTLTPMGDWRTDSGQPHKPPRAWMPAPKPPPRQNATQA